MGKKAGRKYRNDHCCCDTQAEILNSNCMSELSGDKDKI